MASEKETKDQKAKKPAAKKVAVKKKVVVKKKAVVEKAVEKKKSTSSPATKAKKPTPMKVQDDAIYATGRRKESTAKVWMFKGTGKVRINHLEAVEYLSSDRLVQKVLTPLSLVNLDGKYDLRIDVIGGGLTGQADASTLGVARAVLSISDDFKSVLRQNGLLTQDRREKERKKYGKRGARKSPQFRKR